MLKFYCVRINTENGGLRCYNGNEGSSICFYPPGDQTNEVIFLFDERLSDKLNYLASSIKFYEVPLNEIIKTKFSELANMKGDGWTLNAIYKWNRIEPFLFTDKAMKIKTARSFRYIMNDEKEDYYDVPVIGFFCDGGGEEK